MKKVFTLLLFTIILLNSIKTFSQNVVNDPTFNATDKGFGYGDKANEEIHASAVLPDGKIIIGGDFTSYNGRPCNRIARLNTDGSLDATFNTGKGANGGVHTISIQEDGKIIIGGYFMEYNGTNRIHIARLNPDGSLDVTFNVGSGPYYNVQTTALQSDGKIIIGGYFPSYNGIARNQIARLNTDGSLDVTFNVGTGANKEVLTTAVQRDGKIIIGGNFTEYNRIHVGRIARLNTDGSLDPTFSSGGANGSVFSITVHDNGSIIIGGDFTTYNSIVHNRIARLSTDGSLDATFNVGAGMNSSVLSTAIQSNGKILIGGSFTSYNGLRRNRIARLNVDGSLDNTFNSAIIKYGSINTIAVQNDSKIITGGDFTTYYSIGGNHITRLDDNGSLDMTFMMSTGANDIAQTSVIQSDGKIIIGGDFTSYNGIERNHIARLTADGNLDETFQIGTGANGSIYAVALQNDGKIVIGGAFTTFNDVSCQYIARLNKDGSLDTSFDSTTGLDSFVYTIAMQSDGKIVAGGWFIYYNDIPTGNLVRLNEDGSLDNSFSSGRGPDYTVWATAIQSDGKIIIGGDFESYDGTAINYIARVNPDGSLDPSFDVGIGTNYPIFTIALQNDNKIIIGGGFTSYNNIDRNYIARLNTDGSLDATFNAGKGGNDFVFSTSIQSDGKIVTGGRFTTSQGAIRNHIARLNTNGSLDMTFNVGAGTNSYINNITVQSDNKIIIVGAFTSYNGIGRNRVARLVVNPVAEQSIAFNALPVKTYGNTPFNLTATTSSNLDIMYTSSDPTIAYVKGSTVTILKAGTTIIKASQPGNETYAEAVSVEQTLTINKAPITITADNNSKGYGTPNPNLSMHYSGFVNGDDESDITPPSLATEATINSKVGIYAITLTGGAAENYSFIFVNGTLTIIKAQLIATADNKSKIYGTQNPEFTISYTGFTNGDDVDNITPPVVSVAATTANNAGEYPITLTGGTAQNYSVTVVNGTLTINKAQLTATADNKSKIYGTQNPVFTISYTGFVNGDDEDKITPPAASVSAATASNSGAYSITLTGGTAQNYSVTLVNGILTISKAQLTAKADNKSRTYGVSNPEFTISYNGFVNGNDVDNITQPVVSVAAITASNAGEYPITLTGGSAQNYSVTLVNGTLTISKAQLTATADNKSRIYGVSNPEFTISYNGFVSGDDESNITPPVASSLATTSSDAGSYAIILSGGIAQNYSITLINGALTVNKPQLVARADNKSRAYGSPNPEFSITYSGFVNGDNEGDITPPMVFISATTASDAGSYPITLRGGVAEKYTLVLENGTLTVNKIDQTIIFKDLVNKTFGDADFALNATSSSSLPVSYVSSNTARAVINSSNVSIAGPGSVTITASQEGNKNYNAAVTKSQTFCINPAKPVIAKDFTNPESPVLTSSAVTGNQWYKDGLPISNAIQPTLTVNGLGLYTVTASIDNCTSLFSEQVTVIITDIGTVETSNLLTLYPNPADEQIDITLSDTGEKQIEIVSMDGKVMYHTIITGRSVTVKLGHYASGVYVVRARSLKGNQNKRFIKI